MGRWRLCCGGHKKSEGSGGVGQTPAGGKWDPHEGHGPHRGSAAGSSARAAANTARKGRESGS